MTSRRSALCRIAGGAAALLGGPLRAAQHGPRYPTHPISLFVPWPPGGGTDLQMRILAELAAPKLGVQVVIENRSGAGGTLAMPILQQAAPDGYTIAQLPQPIFRAVHMHRVQWDPIRDVTPIIQISGVTFGVVVATDSPIRSFDDVLARARAQPGAVTIGTNGVGTTPHIVVDELFGKLGLRYVHVPYRGTSEQMLSVANGTLTIGINSNGFAPFVDNGRMRLLCTFAAQRSKRWPDVPTLKELGHGIVAESPYGLGGPRGLPRDIVMTLHDAFKAAMYEPRHVQELARYDQELAYLGPDDYARFTRETYRDEQRAVQRLGLARVPE